MKRKLVQHYQLSLGAKKMSTTVREKVVKPEYFFDEDFHKMVVRACVEARLETLAAGVPVFYRDSARNLDIMECPDGRKFETRFLPGVMSGPNYEIVRELHDEKAA